MELNHVRVRPCVYVRVWGGWVRVRVNACCATHIRSYSNRACTLACILATCTPRVHSNT